MANKNTTILEYLKTKILAIKVSNASIFPTGSVYIYRSIGPNDDEPMPCCFISGDTQTPHFGQYMDTETDAWDWQIMIEMACENKNIEDYKTLIREVLKDDKNLFWDHLIEKCNINEILTFPVDPAREIWGALFNITVLYRDTR